MHGTEKQKDKKAEDIMSKNIELDKFYTPTQTAEKCVELMLNTITNRMFVTEYLEPSAGSGNFSNIINGCIAYDI